MTNLYSQVKNKYIRSESINYAGSADEQNTQRDSDGDGLGNLTGFFQAEADSLDATFEHKTSNCPIPIEVSVDLTD